MTTREFRRFGLIAKRDGNPEAVETLKTVIEHLLKRGCHVTVDQHSARFLDDETIPAANRSALAAQSDAVIVIGGDGTLLDAARSVVAYQRPLIGINRGTLGFLVDVRPEQACEVLDQIMAGNFISESRLMINARIERNGETVIDTPALNDVVVNQNGKLGLLEFDTFADGRLIGRHRADGFIVATPTGSTAYALSAGGPIVYPTLDALTLVPICPHTLSDRPIMLSTKHEIVLQLSNRSEIALVSCDGHVSEELVRGDQLVITAHEQHVELLHSQEYDPFAILRSKLHWGNELTR